MDTLEKAKLSAEERGQVLSQWQTCVQMANTVSERRDGVNNLFISINLALIAAISFVWDVRTVALSAAGCICCVLWMRFISNFKALLDEKFKIIDKLEDLLPTQPYRDEWTGLQKSGKYREGTKLEKTLPLLFVCIYAATAIVLLLLHLFGG